MATLYPQADYRPCSNQSGTMAAHLGLILHVQEGNNDLGGEFNDPNSQASYTWVAEKDGTLIQYCDAAARAWAQAEGNDTYNSVGTQGFSTESLTEQQCQAIAGLYRWGHDTYGWPYVLAEQPGQPGFGWHGMGGAAFGGHYDCPGDLRKAQRQHILDLAQGIPDQPAPAPAPPTTTPDGSRTVQEGDSGSDVADLQRDLGGIAVDGDFGPQTLAAVKAFQGAHTLTVDGIVGPQTWGALLHPAPDPAPQPAPAPAPAPSVPAFPGTISQGSTGPAVSAFQQRLHDRGWSIAVDGDDGPATTEIIREFQAQKGLTVDGIGGPQTWNALWTSPVTAG